MSINFVKLHIEYLITRRNVISPHHLGMRCSQNASVSIVFGLFALVSG